jgi:1-acyl-sn-glycerol-3-phosphate acyltransferase
MVTPRVVEDRAAGDDRAGSSAARRRRRLDRLARRLARLVLAVFYRSVEIEGAEHVPASGPVLFVANHGNALVDPIVLVALLPRLPRFLAKHTLWGNPAVLPLLSLVGAIPIYRAQDGATSRNRETFSRCFEELAAGGAVALFPEGVSHDQPSLQPLRTGAARIALGAQESGAESVAIVPVGLTFEEKGRFRSRLLVTVGAAIRGSAEGDDESGVRDLTQKIEAGLRGVTLNFDSWHTARLVERAAEIYASEPKRPMPGRSGLGERFSLRQSFGAGYEAVRAQDRERVEALEAMARRYELLLETLHLRDDHVIADYPWSHVAGYLGFRVPTLAVLLPIALVGLALNYLPYRVPGWVASTVEDQGDQPATYKVISGLFLFPIAWAIEIALAGRAWGALGASLMAVVAPATGWVALRFFEHTESFWSELRAWLTLRLASHRAAELRILRGMMRDDLQALVASTAGPADS